MNFKGSLSGRTRRSSGRLRGPARDPVPGGKLSPEGVAEEGTKLGSWSRRLREATAVSEYVNGLPVTGRVVYSLLMQKMKSGPMSGTY